MSVTADDLIFSQRERVTPAIHAARVETEMEMRV
jgi:hypothetical protein